MNDLLDDRLRTMMRTATADAPEAPTVDDLQAITVVGAEPRQRSMRPIAAAAAVMAVAAAGALVWWPNGDAGPDPADSPESTEAVVSGSYLDAYYLPNELPEGWQIVGKRQDRAGSIEFVGDSVVFARRDGTERAVVSLTPVDDTAPATTEAAVEVATGDTQPPPPASVTEAIWNEQFRWLTWTPNGQQILVTPADGMESSARDLAVDLVGVAPMTAATLDVSQGSDWVKVKEYVNDPNGVVSAGANSLSLVTERGLALWITVRRADGLLPSDVHRPVAGFTDLYETISTADDQIVTISRVIGGDIVEVSLRSPDPEERSVVRRLVADLRPVTEQEWSAAVPDLSITIGGLPTVRSFELLDHTVSVHFDGTIGGVCVERGGGASACIYLAGVEANGHVTGSFPATGFRLDDETWVAVSSIPEGAQMCTDPQLLQGAQAATADNDGQTLVLLVAPADFTEVFACPITGSTDYTLYMASPPLP